MRTECCRQETKPAEILKPSSCFFRSCLTRLQPVVSLPQRTPISRVGSSHRFLKILLASSVHFWSAHTQPCLYEDPPWGQSRAPRGTLRCRHQRTREAWESRYERSTSCRESGAHFGRSGQTPMASLQPRTSAVPKRRPVVHTKKTKTNSSVV